MNILRVGGKKPQNHALMSAEYFLRAELIRNLKVRKENKCEYLMVDY